jgi:hypothetical protein
LLKSEEKIFERREREGYAKGAKEDKKKTEIVEDKTVRIH